MASSSNALSKTLKSITITKFKELNKQQAKYESSKLRILQAVDAVGDDSRARISHLLDGVKDIAPTKDDDFQKNVARWLDQSRYDPTVPDHMLVEWEQQLRQKLDVQSRRLNLAELYSRLLTEWLESPPAVVGDTHEPQQSIEIKEENGSPSELSENDPLQQLCDKFAAVVFTPCETDGEEIDAYLHKLFNGSAGAKALAQLRNSIGDEDDLLNNKTPFSTITLGWCIEGLLHNTLLTVEKKAVLQDFRDHEDVMQEIADVLNMRWADFEDWSWDAGEEGIPVMPRQQLNGKTRMHMDEDIMQALFLHYVGTTWSMSLKNVCLQVFDSIWKTEKSIPAEELDRRRFYLGPDCYKQIGETLAQDRSNTYRGRFFMSHLPSAAGAATEYETEPNLPTRKPSSHEIKQELLRQLATDLHLGQWLDHETAIVQSDMQWYATGLPHSTLRAIMKFIGMSDAWIAFFTKFLEAPLNVMSSSSTGDASETAANFVRIRKRGVPIAHALEVFFGEVVLFFMDIAVNQETGMLLYRQHDDLWLCGSPKKCSMAWQTMQNFAKVMGLDFNFDKTGSVYLVSGEGKSHDLDIQASLPTGPVAVDFLQLSPETGKWTINQSVVDAHIEQLQKQLSACTSVLSWVHTWNSCISRFFVGTFGVPANCFGNGHVDEILQTHARMHRFLFLGENGTAKSATGHLRRWILDRFGVSDVPDAFFFMPEDFGGLALRNPFTELFPLRNDFQETPEARVQKFLAEEKEGYEGMKTTFETLGKSGRRRRFRSIFPGESRRSSRSVKLFPDGTDSFMSFEDFVAWRESESSALKHLHVGLRSVPPKKWAGISKDIEDASAKIGVSLKKLSREKKWVLQMYASELFRQCGGLNLIDKSLLPLGVLAVVKQHRVQWQMVV